MRSVKANFKSLFDEYYKSKITIVISTLILTLGSTSALAGWELQWIDQFDGTGVNRDNWTAQIEANYNNEVQCYTDDDTSAVRNYEVSNGTLKIIARKGTVDCPGLNGLRKTWTSGRLNSKDKAEFLYGRIESRIRFLNTERGTWPAFWMLENRIAEYPRKGDNDFVNWPNPGAGEIDVWEWYSNAPDTYITNFFNTNNCASEVRYTYPGGAPDVAQWHKYAIEWSEERIAFYVNEIMVTSHDVSNCPQYKEPMFVLLNVAMGGNLGGSIDPALNKATLEIDYVAHCTATIANDVAFCDESSNVGLDDDADGVANGTDKCPETAANAEVDTDGCSADQEINVAPQAVLSLTQNGKSTQSVVPSNGLVQVNIQVTDENSADGFTLDWDTSGLPSITENYLSISFDPSNMTSGDYNVSADVTDTGLPTLTSSASLSFDVDANLAPIAVVAQSSVSAQSGASVSLSADQSTDPNQDTLTYAWAQINGPVVTLLNSTSATPSFTAPTVTSDTSLSFTVTVSDGKASDSATVTVSVAAQVSTPTGGGSSSGGAFSFLLLIGLGTILVKRKSYIICARR